MTPEIKALAQGILIALVKNGECKEPKITWPLCVRMATEILEVSE